MDRSWWWKFLFLVLCVVGAGMYVYPTVARLDLDKTDFPVKQKINLGLDLQGGLYMVLGVDFDQVFREVMQRQSTNLEKRLQEKKIAIKKIDFEKKGFPKDDPRILVEFSGTKTDIEKLLKDEYDILRVTAERDGYIELGISRAYRGTVRDNTISQSIEVIRNRIDEFGVTEPSITSQGIDRIVVELPGVKEVERAKDLIGRTAKLEFRIVADKEKTDAEVAGIIEKIEEENNLKYDEKTQKFSEYVAKINELAAGKLPKDTEIAYERIEGITGEVSQRVPYLIGTKAEVTGDYLQDAFVQFEQDTRRPYVAFQFGPRGAALFEKLTGDNIGRRLAIVLDGIVHSAPVIQSRIGARGQITLGQGAGDKLMREAKDLSIVLRAGALPAQLEFMEQRVVGPSLGQDSIRLGGTAAIFGAALVFLFIFAYYRMSGGIAVLSLFLNVLFVLSILVGLEATLTLPGIAGIALTVGIAVDSNVVIYERIREELRAGKTLRGSVEAGFQKAFRTILDANVTNAAAALVLLNFGTGPIKGFAVTMLIGIVTTLFTAVFVGKLFFSVYLKRLEGRSAKALSI